MPKVPQIEPLKGFTPLGVKPTSQKQTIERECPECGYLTDKFYEPENPEASCKECVDGFWEMMGDDPHGKGWQS